MPQLRITGSVTFRYDQVITVDDELARMLISPNVTDWWKKQAFQENADLSRPLLPVNCWKDIQNIGFTLVVASSPAATDSPAIKPSTIMQKTIRLMTVVDIARVVHEVNMAYFESIKISTHEWNTIPKGIQQKAIDQVNYILLHPEIEPRSWHDGWVNHMEGEGWKFGKVSDIDKKVSQFLLPFDSLPTQQQTTYFLMKQIVLSLKEFLTEDE